MPKATAKLAKRKQRLKVYRTQAGFHDAYVAAPSMKAALEAWGAKGNLFGQEAAEVVTDPAFTAEPLSRPGEVIKVSRGGTGAMLKSAGEGKALTRASERKTRPKAKVPPSRKPVEAATEALDRFNADAATAVAEIEARMRKLEVEHRKLMEAQERKRWHLKGKLEDARSAYEAALARWSEAED